MLQTRSDALRVWLVNTAAVGGASVIVTNTPLPVIINNSGGLFAMQSGAWNVSSTILNSAGWIVNVANTGGAFNILNSGGLFAMQSGAWAVSSTILNSAGWVFAQSNTANMSVIVQNSGGLFAQQSGPWTVTIANTGGTTLSQTIANTAGWIVAQSNTGGNVNVANSAGWVVFDIDSAAVGSVVTSVASTIGTVNLAASNTKRVTFSVYNASTNPMFMKLGSGATTSSYTLMMVASGYYELPRPIYNGVITAVWQTANGNALVSETT